MIAPDDPRYPLAKMMLDNGIVPQDVLADGFSREGYFSFGESLNRDGLPESVWSPWPEAMLNDPSFVDALTTAFRGMKSFGDIDQEEIP